MPYRFKEARLQSGKSVAEVAKELQVAETSVRNWDNGYKKPSIDLLIRLADYYGVTTDYLLGRAIPSMTPRLEYEPVSPDALPALHGFPVWNERYGWGLVNSAKRQIDFVDGHTMPFADALNLSTLPKPFMIGYHPTSPPLTPDEVCSSTESLWVIPIGVPYEIQTELQGWYRLNGPFVTNEFGQRFYLDNYGAKWLAFTVETRIPNCIS